MADKYICSKLACDNAYTIWEPAKEGKNDLPRKKRHVTVTGGAGVATKNLVTPHGVVTKISEEDIETLRKECPSFVRHEEAGFIKVLGKDPGASVDNVSKDLSTDKATPKTPDTIGKKETDKGKKD